MEGFTKAEFLMHHDQPVESVHIHDTFNVDLVQFVPILFLKLTGLNVCYLVRLFPKHLGIAPLNHKVAMTCR
jgi:hypothetical protein